MTLYNDLPEELIDDEKPKSVVNLLYKDAKSPHATRARHSHSHPPVVASGQGNVVKSETHSKPAICHYCILKLCDSHCARWSRVKSNYSRSSRDKCSESERTESKESRHLAPRGTKKVR